MKFKPHNPSLSIFLLFFFFILWCSSSSLYAQPIYSPGEVVLINGDTLKGLIREIASLKRFTQCFYKSDIKGPSSIYYPGEIQSFSIENRKHYKSEEFSVNGQTGTVVFMEYFVEGAICLMKYRKDYYLKNESGRLQKIPFKLKNYDLSTQREEVGQIRIEWYQFIKDIYTKCSSQSSDKDYFDDFDKLRHHLDGMVDVVRKYNECMGSDYFLYGKGVPFAAVDIGPAIALHRTSFHFGVQPNYNAPLGTPYDFLEIPNYRNIGMELSLPIIIRTIRNPSNWSIFLEPYIRQYQLYYEVLQEDLPYPPQTYTDFRMEWLATGITFGGKYNLSYKKPAISIQSGMRFDFILSPQIDIVKEQIVTRTEEIHITRTAKSPFPTRNNQINFCLQTNIADFWDPFPGKWAFSFGFLLGTGVASSEGTTFGETITIDSSTSAFFIKTSFLW